MKKIIIYCCMLALFCGMQKGNAQRTFDDKKKESSTTSAKKTGADPVFNYPKLTTKGRVLPKSSRTSSFQMPSIFNKRQIISGYIHKVVQKAEGRPIYIESQATASTLAKAKQKSPDAVVREYLSDVASLLGVAEGSSEFQLKSSHTDAVGQEHFKMQQVFKGLKVYGSEVIVHLNLKSNRTSLNGRNTPTPQLKSIVPKMSLQNSFAFVERDLGTTIIKNTSVDKTTRLAIPETEEELIIYTHEGEHRLTRHLTVFPTLIDRWEYFLDANTGQIFDKYYHTCTLFPDLGEEGGHEHNVTTALPPTTANGTDLRGVNRQLNTFLQGRWIRRNPCSIAQNQLS